jgi:hypothetical protein
MGYLYTSIAIMLYNPLMSSLLVQKIKWVFLLLEGVNLRVSYSILLLVQIIGGNADIQQDGAPIGRMTQQGMIIVGTSLIMGLIIGFGIYFYRRWKITRY